MDFKWKIGVADVVLDLIFDCKVVRLILDGW